MGEKTPNDSHYLESERFWEWFYELATRESEEMTDLSFRSQHFNIGVILVAHSETYERFGKSPYIRRANTYASNECQSIYIISRGPVKGKIAKEIASDLIDTGCFECLTKDSDIRIQEDINKPPLLVICIALKPSLLAIVEKAWEELLIAKQKGSPIVVSVREVSKSGVSIEVYGLRVSVDNENLSSLKIDDAQKYFQVNDELAVNIVECHEESQKVLLSNVDTDTDPKRLVDEFKDYKETPIDARIERIIVYSDGREIGLTVGFPGKQLKGFVPRQFATYSRFGELSKGYQPGQDIRVLIKNFSAEFKTFVCYIYGLEDPWLSLGKYEVGNQTEGVVRQISQNYILCELVPGVEARIPLDEVGWGKEDIKKEILRGFKLGDIVHGKIIDINAAKKRLLLSIKRITKNPIELFFEKYANGDIEGNVAEVSQVSAKLLLGPERIDGYLHVSELMWNYCGDLKGSLRTGQLLTVKVLSYDPFFENIRVSHKRTYSNDFQEFSKTFKVGDFVTARLKCVGDDRIIFSLSFDERMQVESYVHKSEISNVCFIDEVTIKNVFVPNRAYGFIVKRMDERYRVIELSRKRYLKTEIKKIEYGIVYQAITIRNVNDRMYVHGDIVEGFVIVPKGIGIGEIIDVLPAKIDVNSGYVELNLV